MQKAKSTKNNVHARKGSGIDNRSTSKPVMATSLPGRIDYGKHAYRKTSVSPFAGTPSGLEALAENLWWSWNPGARMLFKTLDRQAWKESGHNPDKMLRELPRELLEKAGADAEYIRRYDDTSMPWPTFPPNTVCIAPCPFMPAGLGFLAGDYHQRMQRFVCPAGGGGVHVSGRLFPATDPG
jgi:hypothetical protein